MNVECDDVIDCDYYSSYLLFLLLDFLFSKLVCACIVNTEVNKASKKTEIPVCFIERHTQDKNTCIISHTPDDEYCRSICMTDDDVKGKLAKKSTMLIKQVLNTRSSAVKSGRITYGLFAAADLKTLKLETRYLR